MEKENKSRNEIAIDIIEKGKKVEQEVVLVRDFPQYEKILNIHRCQEAFFCKKCDSSIICLSREFNKNNIMNSMDNSDGNDEYEKIVLECGNCHYKDILVKFLKIKDDIFEDRIYPKKKQSIYISPPNKPTRIFI